MQNMQVVLQKSNNKVLRCGYCDFEHDGSFDAENEKIIEKYCNCDLLAGEFFYNEETDAFYQQV